MKIYGYCGFSHKNFSTIFELVRRGGSLYWCCAGLLFNDGLDQINPVKLPDDFRARPYEETPEGGDDETLPGGRHLMELEAIFLFNVGGLPYKLVRGSLFRNSRGLLLWKLSQRSYFHWDEKSGYLSAGEIQQRIRKMGFSTNILIEVNLKKHYRPFYVKFEPHHLTMFTYWS